MQLDPDSREFVESFNAHEVRYLVVGGYALAAHGLPRATGDLDAWVWVGGDNAERVLAALTAVGFGSLGLEIADFDHRDSIAQLGYPPYRIDILTSIDGVEFDDAWSPSPSPSPPCRSQASRADPGLPMSFGATCARPDSSRSRFGAFR